MSSIFKVHTAGQSQSERNACNLVVIELTDPIPGPSPREGKGARRAGRGVYNVKIVETIRMFDFAIALVHSVELKRFFSRHHKYSGKFNH